MSLIFRTSGAVIGAGLEEFLSDRKKIITAVGFCICFFETSAFFSSFFLSFFIYSLGSLNFPNSGYSSMFTMVHFFSETNDLVPQ